MQGAREISNLVQSGLGFAPSHTVVKERLDDKIERSATEAARRKFTPEFMNRIDKVVVFKPLHREQLQHILEIELGMVQRRILMARNDRQFVFKCTKAFKEFLLHEGIDSRYGARHLKRAIERHLVAPLANLVATSQVRFGDFIRVDRTPDGEMMFTRESERAIPVNIREEYFPVPSMPLVAQATGM